MDFLFNVFIPESSKKTIILEPVQKTFITGLSSKYNDNYPLELSNYLNKKLFYESISEINITLETFWPCLPALIFGYLFCIITFGLSFLIPMMCILDAELNLKRTLERQNNEIYRPRGLGINFKKAWFTSWLEINVIDQEMYENKISFL